MVTIALFLDVLVIMKIIFNRSRLRRHGDTTPQQAHHPPRRTETGPRAVHWVI